jgi:hypothetical protein
MRSAAFGGWPEEAGEANLRFPMSTTHISLVALLPLVCFLAGLVTLFLSALARIDRDPV